MKPEDINRMGEDQANRVAYLVAAYIGQTITEQEHDELDDWITSSDENQLTFEELTDPEFIKQGLEIMSEPDANALRERISRKIKLSEKEVAKKRRRWMPYSIAASLIIVTGLVIFFMTNRKARTIKEIVNTSVIKPGGNYAVLMLGDGRMLNLEEAKNGLLDSTNGSEVLKSSDGQINYVSIGVSNNAYHILVTPVGGQYSVLLPDGTRVWLNSSSSLKYPVAFTGDERVVELSGEGYFEVAPSNSPEGGETSPGLKATPSEGGQETSPGSASHPLPRGIPFIVKVGEMKVEVLGTHFNINAYDDEPVVRTVLLEGKVVVSREDGKSGRREDGKSESWELKPGEEARMDKRGEVTVSSSVNVDEAVAWKNGMFMFKDLPIKDVMRQVARWYDAEIVFEGKTDEHFNATIYRKEPVEKLLYILEETDKVHFKIEGRKIVVRP